MGFTDNNNGGWCGDGSWFIILFLIFAMFGWGGYGFGGNGGNGATNGYVLTSDFANIERKLDGINNGICDSTFCKYGHDGDTGSGRELLERLHGGQHRCAAWLLRYRGRDEHKHTDN